MLASGAIGASNRKFLETALEAGHAAAHRGHEPKRSDVNTVIEIVENVLSASYVLETQAVELERNTPKRVAAKVGDG